MTSVAETALSSPRSTGLTGRGEFLKSSGGGGERAGDPMTTGVKLPGVPLKRGIVVPAGGVPYCCLRWRTLGASIAPSSSMSRSECTGLPIFTGFEGVEGVEDMVGDKVEHKDTSASSPITSRNGNTVVVVPCVTPKSPGQGRHNA
jgi:hypothetical protein